MSGDRAESIADDSMVAGGARCCRPSRDVPGHLVIEAAPTASREGRYVRPARGSVGEYLVETWLPTRRVNLRESTALGYQKVIERRIVPMIGDVQLTAVDAARFLGFSL